MTAVESRYFLRINGHPLEPQKDGFSHFSARHTPAGVTSTAYYYYDAWILARMAEVLGKSEDAKTYSALAQSIKVAFNSHFFDANSSQYATGSQTSNALALQMGFVPPEKIPAVIKNLLNDITTEHEGHLSTGIIGSNSLVQVLPQNGLAEVMYLIATQTTYPSLGYQVMQGATTVCETYECGPWLSQNMKMLCSVDKFFYRNLAGINFVSPGYRRILIEPQPVGDLRSVAASRQTVRGLVTVDWIKGDTSLDLNVSIPAGTEADIRIPKLGLSKVVIDESGKTVWTENKYMPGAPGLAGAIDAPSWVGFHVGSGSYSFSMHGVLF